MFWIVILLAFLCSSTFGASGIKTTYWAPSSDAGGCQLPSANYRITNALALGQQRALGNLVWRQGLCGQVLDVNCGHGTVQAVVASTCNLGSDSCGADLIGKTWRTATNNASPGIAWCTVTLSNTNPLNDGGMQCFHRPNSDIGNAYYTAIGVLNTNGRIARAANLAGIWGNRGNDNWFQFNSNGRPLFGNSATVTFTFEDGGNNHFKLSECRSGGHTQIFS